MDKIISMKTAALIIVALTTIFFGQNLPDTWSPSYCTYDLAATYPAGSYGIGLGIDNYCIYDHPDSIAYDEKRFDLWARCGVLRKFEIEFKYSYPTSGLISGKFRFIEGVFDAAAKFGFGYMKSTRTHLITDYVYDFYPTLLLSKRIGYSLALVMAPKIIYSIHARDVQEHSTRPNREIFHYGYGAGIVIGNDFKIIPEANWLWGNNEGVNYMVNQFGIGVDLTIK